MKILFFFVKEKLQLLSLSVDVPADEILKWIGYMEVTIDILLQDLKNEIAQQDTPVKAELLIQQYHTTLISMLNAVTNQAKVHKEQPVVINAFYQRAAISLQRLLDLCERYNHHITANLEVPAVYLQKTKEEMKEQVHNVRKHLTEKDNVRLLRVVLTPVEDFLEEETVTLYTRLYYFKGIITDMEGLRNNTNINQQIRDILIKWNINNEDTLLYLKASYDQLLQGAESIQEKVDLLALWTKQTNQVIMREEAALVKGIISVYDFMTRYFQEELSYLQRETLQSVAPPATATHGNTDSLVSTTGKVHTSMNLSELAAWIKVLLEAEILVNEVTLEPLRIIADTFSTSNKETLKFDSIRTKFYNIDPNTGKSVIDICSRIYTTARRLF